MTEKYLVVITTILVVTQVIRVTQNFIQLSRQNKAIKRELDRVGKITDEDIIIQKRFFRIACEYLDERMTRMSRNDKCTVSRHVTLRE